MRTRRETLYVSCEFLSDVKFTNLTANSALNLKVSQAEFSNLILNLTCDTKEDLQVFRGDFWGFLLRKLAAASRRSKIERALGI